MVFMLLGLFCVIPTSPNHAQTQGQYLVYLPFASTSLNFQGISQSMIDMNQQGLFQGPDSNGVVTFDENGARQHGFDQSSIVVAKEVTSFTNDLIHAAATADTDPTIIEQTYNKAFT
jgi:hypothetical protein